MAKPDEEAADMGLPGDAGIREPERLDEGEDVVRGEPDRRGKSEPAGCAPCRHRVSRGRSCGCVRRPSQMPGGRGEHEPGGRRHHAGHGAGGADHRQDLQGVHDGVEDRAADGGRRGQDEEPPGPAAPDDGRAEGRKPDAVDEHMGPGAVQEGIGQRRPGTPFVVPPARIAPAPCSGVTVSSGAPSRSALITSLDLDAAEGHGPAGRNDRPVDDQLRNPIRRTEAAGRRGCRSRTTTQKGDDGRKIEDRLAGAGRLWGHELLLSWLPARDPGAGGI